MTDDPTSRLEERIGESADSVVDFAVESGMVAEFARAIGETNPIFLDSAAAERRGLDRIPAPLTFSRVSLFPRYRSADSDRFGFDLGFDRRYEVHGQQEYDFERPVFVGDCLTGSTTLTGVDRQEGSRGGEMTFATLETEYVDADDELVVTERSTIIETDGAIGGDGSPQPPEESAAESGQPSPPSFASITWRDRKQDTRPSIETLDEGTDGPVLLVDEVSVSDFVRYAGASGDLNPIHYDRDYARRLGNPDVFGQGMLTAGYASTLLSNWFGVDQINRFRNRFTARVWPGDSLTVTGDVVDVDPPFVDVEFSIARHTGEVVLRGDATVECGE